MNGPLVSERAGAVLTLTIDRPDAHNALNAEVLHALRHAVLAADRDPQVRAVIVTGRGEKAFSAGADLREIVGMTADQAAGALRLGQEVFRDLQRAAIPVIAAVNGVALGGGFELALSATFPVLSTSASLGLPEAGLGLIPGYGGTQRLPRLVGSAVAAHLMFTGGRLTADRAHQLGITPVPPVAPGDLMATATAIAESIAAQGPGALRAIHECLEFGRDAPLDAGLAVEGGLAALALAGSESSEGITAFLERRPARFAVSTATAAKDE